MHYRVAVVGSGFGGIGAGVHLKRAGIEDFVIFERARDLGGTWRDNQYPGCACDVQSSLYSFSFALNPDWSSNYSGQEEIWNYLRRCADEHGITPHVRYEHEVLAADWNGSASRWDIQTAAGSHSAQAIILANGPLSDPFVPELPGVAAFAGAAFHSAQWQHSTNLRGKRVAVIGTGASAAQFIPAIQPLVQSLHVYQRTPAWVMPRHDRAIAAPMRRVYRRAPWLQRLVRGGIFSTREMAVVLFRHPALMRFAQRRALRHLARSVPDGQLRAKLTPHYTMGCKRVILSDDYLQSLAQPNVEVVTTPIKEVRAQSIVDAEGLERAADVIIYGTGFRATDPPLASHIRGSDGRTLAEVWNGSPKAYCGTSVHGFPNLFQLLGPNTGLGHNSVIYMMEAQITHVIRALRYMERAGAIQPTADAQQRFVSTVDTRMQNTVWMAGGCRSWYLDRTGRNSTLWPGSSLTFHRTVANFRARDYEVVS